MSRETRDSHDGEVNNPNTFDAALLRAALVYKLAVFVIYLLTPVLHLLQGPTLRLKGIIQMRIA
jgi:hypothetical protein